MDADAFPSLRGTAIHEALHALGFSSASWPLFRNGDGTPMTPRESDGLPARVTRTCSDGTPTSNQMDISAATLEVAMARGTTVTRVVTPRVRNLSSPHISTESLLSLHSSHKPRLVPLL